MGSGGVPALLYGLYACCGALLLIDFFVHRHSQHPWDSWQGFYPVYGFVGCVLLVLIAKLLRKLVKRPENHYDRSSGR